jgi:hypothetical protein
MAKSQNFVSQNIKQNQEGQVRDARWITTPCGLWQYEQLDKW